MLSPAALLLGLVRAASAQSSAASDDWEYLAWEDLYDARFSAALGRSAGGSSSSLPGQEFTSVLTVVRDELSPIKADTHYWLALALLRAGEAQAAADALAEVGPREVMSDRDRALLSEIHISTRKIDRLPLHEDFEGAASPAPWVRSPARGDTRDLYLTDLNGDRVMVWTTVVQQNSDDSIMLVFTDRGPSSIHLRLRADRFPANMRCELEDLDGTQWTARVPTVPATDWVDLDLGLSDFALVGDPFGPRPDPRRVRALRLTDVTGFRGEQSGANDIFVDDLELLP